MPTLLGLLTPSCILHETPARAGLHPCGLPSGAAARRYWLLLAMAALLVAAPMARCQADEAVDDDSSEPEIVAEPAAAAKQAAAAAGSLDQYKELALEYAHTAAEVGKGVYVRL